MRGLIPFMVYYHGLKSSLFWNKNINKLYHCIFLSKIAKAFVKNKSEKWNPERILETNYIVI